VCGARSSARLERQAHNLSVAGSNPAGPTISCLVFCGSNAEIVDLVLFIVRAV
jgi:hypothetical protein